METVIVKFYLSLKLHVTIPTPTRSYLRRSYSNPCQFCPVVALVSPYGPQWPSRWLRFSAIVVRPWPVSSHLEVDCEDNQRVWPSCIVCQTFLGSRSKAWRADSLSVASWWKWPHAQRFSCFAFSWRRNSLVRCSTDRFRHPRRSLGTWSTALLSSLTLWRDGWRLSWAGRVLARRYRPCHQNFREATSKCKVTFGECIFHLKDKSLGNKDSWFRFWQSFCYLWTTILLLIKQCKVFKMILGLRAQS